MVDLAEIRRQFEEARRALEEADSALAQALEARAISVQKLAELREQDSEGYYAMPRDVDIIRHMQEYVKTFPKPSVEAVCREVLSACAAMVAPVAVSYLGPEGGFAHLAARRYFGASTPMHAVSTAEEALHEVNRDRSSFAVVPLETSTDGAITATLLGLARSDVTLCGEFTIAAAYHVLSKSGVATDVQKVYGVPNAIGASERFLRAHFPGAVLLDVPSGDVAAQHAIEDSNAAVVGSEMLIELYPLRIVHSHVEDVAGVEMRFAVAGKDLPSRTGADRTLLAMALQDTPEGLYEALKPFSERGIHLTRLETRPTHGADWRYLFFVEFDGHITDRPVLAAVEELRAMSKHLKVLGSYPRPAGS